MRSDTAAMHSPSPDAGTGDVPRVITAGQVILWWELRRLLYNVALLAIGVTAIAGMEWLMSKVIPLGEDAIEPMALVFGVLLYGFMANLCYTLGWIVELWGRKTDPVSARARGQWMFRTGLLFSCLLTSLPFWFACLFLIVNRAHAH